jgi:hypothetical protein
VCSEMKNGDGSTDVDNKSEPLMLTRNDESPRSERKEHHRIGPSTGTTGALNILKEKCALSSWRSTKDENIKNNNAKDQSLTNGHSQPTTNQSVPMNDSKQPSPCDKDLQANETIDLSNSYQYDLYAVCNHHGTDLQGGHYTATCRNPTDGKWYAFDDVNTRTITKPEDEVISEDAYILFYQKCSNFCPNTSVVDARSPASSRKLKALENKKCPISQPKAVVNGPLGENHWVYRMPDFSYKGKATVPKAAPTSTLPSKQKATENGKAKNITATSSSQNKSNSVNGKRDSSDITETNDNDEASDTKQVITSNPVADNDNFQRNSKGKYATLPAMPKRCLENDDSSTKCDTNSSKFLRSSNQAFSTNIDNSSIDGAVSEGEGESQSMSRKKDSSSLKSAVKILQNPTKLDQRTDSDLELDIDIQRPIDKNDVD